MAKSPTRPPSRNGSAMRNGRIRAMMTIMHRPEAELGAYFGRGQLGHAQCATPPPQSDTDRRWYERAAQPDRQTSRETGDEALAGARRSVHSGSANSKQPQAMAGRPGSAVGMQWGVPYSWWTLRGWPHSAHLSCGFLASLMRPMVGPLTGT